MISKKDIQTFNEIRRVLLHENDFIYLLPHPMLRDWISNYTITFPNKSIISDNYTVIPHGSATLVFSCDDSGLSGNLFGPSTKPCMVGGHANAANLLLIIEFQPAGLHVFTSVDQMELSDTTLSFKLINPFLNSLIMEIFERSNNLVELIDSLDRLFLSNIHNLYPSELKIATKMIIDHIGNISNKELSGAVNYCERHINRIFNQYLGMNSKTFSRMVRINKAIRLLQNPSSSIACISDATGFFDVPHLIHDFKSICGMTPQEYRNNLSDFYSEIAKF